MSLFRLRSSFGFLMKLVLLLSLLGVTVVCHHHHDSCETAKRDRHHHRCPSDWITFDRPQGRWCVKLFTSPNLNWNAAQTKCSSIGAKLTGVQNPTERMTLAAEARRMILATGAVDAAIWLGATRKPECPRVNICRPEDTFQWVDGFTTGNAGMQYQPGNPNGATSNNVVVQSCMQQLVFAHGEIRKGGDFHGGLDDQYCFVRSSNRMYACGKRP